MSTLASPISVAESFGEFRSNGLVLDGSSTRLERVYDYNTGKFHPVHLGDVLNGRYKVMDKLGSGSYGVVWLCRDTASDSSKYVAVKIIMADASIHDCPELRVNRLTKLGIDKGELAERFGVTLDNFSINGPNGRHFCLVYPVLGPPVSSFFQIWRLEDPAQVLRKVCLQVTQAVAALHSYGVCHDLRPENILSRISGLDGLSEEHVKSILGEPVTTKVLVPSGSGAVPHSKPSAPQYLVEPVRWYIADPEGSHGHSHPQTLNLKKPSSRLVLPSVCIIDFHESFMVNNLPEDLGIPQQYHPPEYIFDKEIGYGTDLWALACTLFEIRTGKVLFNTIDDDLDDYLVSMVEILGKLPEPWWSTTWEERRAYFDNEKDQIGRPVRARRSLPEGGGTSDLTSRPRSLQDAISGRLPRDDGNGLNDDHRSITQEETVLFADLLERLLKYSPEGRVTAEEALDHPWFTL